MIDKFLTFRETKGWKILKILQEAIIVLAAVSVVLLFIAEVLARYIFNINFVGYDEIVLLAVVWLDFIGGGYAMYKKEHISAEMLQLFLKGRKLQGARLITIWLTFAIAVVLVKWGIDFTTYSLASPSYTIALGIPKIAGQLSLVVGYVLVAIYSLFYAVEDTIKFVRRETNE